MCVDDKPCGTLFHLGPFLPSPMPSPPDSCCTQPQPCSPSTLHIPALSLSAAAQRSLPWHPTTSSPFITLNSVCLAADSLNPSREALKIDCSSVMGLMYTEGVCLCRRLVVFVICSAKMRSVNLFCYTVVVFVACMKCVLLSNQQQYKHLLLSLTSGFKLYFNFYLFMYLSIM